MHWRRREGLRSFLGLPPRRQAVFGRMHLDSPKHPSCTAGRDLEQRDHIGIIFFVSGGLEWLRLLLTALDGKAWRM